MAYVGRAWGKLLLFGEHSAVYGYPAVGLALPETLELQINPGETAPEEGARLDEPPLSAMFRALESLLPPISAAGLLGRLKGSVQIISSIPQSLGYGSSAALCSAFSRAALSLLSDVGFVANDQDIWRLANNLERVFHGTPSGIDTGLATLGGIQAFHFGDTDLPSATQLPSFAFSLVTGAVPRESSTKELVARLRDRLDSGDALLKGRLAALGQTAERGIDVIQDADADRTTEVGALATNAHEILREIGLSTAPMETAIKTGLASGATGGKLSGAGGGGAFYLLYRETGQAQEAHGALRSAWQGYPGSEQWPLRVFASENGSVRRVAA